MEILVIFFELMFVVSWIIFRLKIERLEKNRKVWGCISTLSILGDRKSVV